MSIRSATSSDASIISSLILDASLSVKEQDFTSKGWALLEQTNTPAAVVERFASENYFALIFELDGNVSGYIGMLDFEKIDHMFVLPEYRKRGIAKSLWTAAQEVCANFGNNEYYWVRSSSYAVQVYKSFGFCLSGERQESNGISFQFMEKGVKRKR